jgi:hypothetical protein
MANPQLILTRFCHTTAKAAKEDEYEFPIYSPIGDYSYENLLDACINDQRERPKAPRYWSTAKYTKVHRRDNISYSTAALIEYKASQASDLDLALSNFQSAYYLLPTETNDTNCISVMVPFRTPVNPDDYGRVVSFIIDRLGVYGVQQGAMAATFLVKPTPFSQVIFNDGDILDADAYANSTAWNDASQYFVEAKPSQMPQSPIRIPKHITHVNDLPSDLWN